MRVLFYGAGALGQAFGGLLALAGHEVDLLLRSRFKQAIDRDGLVVTGIYGDFKIAADQLGLYDSLENVRDKSFDFVVVTTKAYDTDAAIAGLRELSDQSFRAVSMQNGCGNLEKLIDAFGEERSLAARVITGFEIVRPGQINITVSADATHVGGARDGEIPPAAEQLASTINASGLPCIATAHVRRDLFAKLLYNCALNPLGAILGVHYGALSEEIDTREIMDRVIEETFRLIVAMGGSTLWPDAQAYRRIFYEQQIPTTYNHRPSMLQDLENGKPTEVDAMTGYVSKQGRLLGVATPACDLLSALVRFKEAKQRTP